MSERRTGKGEIRLSSINWSGEQRDAIETRGGNLLVSAAAGSGKTAVLVERIIRCVLREKEPVDLDRLLVVTFTDAAAGEMRQRVGAALAGALQESPAGARLQRQLLLLSRANIGTMHSFCSQVVRSHFYLLNLDPGFRVMDENETSMLRSEVMEEVLENLYEEHRDAPPHAPFLYLARSLAGGHGDDRELVRLAFSLYDFAHSLPRPAAWLNRLAKSLEEAAALPWEDQFWVDEWREMLRLEMDNWVETLEEARLLALGPGGPPKYARTLAGDLGKVRGWRELAGGSLAELRDAVENGQHWPSLPRVGRGEADDGIKERIQKLRGGIKKKVNEFYRDFLSRPAGEMVVDLSRVAPLVQALVEVVLSFKEAYRKLKLERAVADFSDLEHYALAILARNGEGSPWGEKPPEDPEEALLPSPVALEYQEHFAEVLVDEYQDINGVQEAVLQLVSRPGNRFLVGDVKQSIYRFRLADPTVFLHCYHRFNDLYSGRGPEPGWRLDLRSNFRSRPGILQAVNYFFQRLMNRRVAEIDYDERARLNPGIRCPDSPCGETGEPVEIHLLEYNEPRTGAGGEGEASSGDAELEELDLVRLEARWVAERIHDMVIDNRQTVYDRDAGAHRPVTWRDVVVLMRSPRGRVGVFLEEFRRLGIPAYADGGGGYFAAPEVQAVLSLLQVIDNPRRDIPLAAVLRSPVVGLDASGLAKIRLACPEGDFYTAVCRVAGGQAGVEAKLVQKLRDFLDRLEEWRDLARRLPPADLLEELYRQTGYYMVAGAMPGGAVRQANLRALVDRARSFDGTVYRGLFRFLRFIEQVRERGGDMDTARSLGENEDVVRLMSIHRSKGLEFPVVIVAGLGRRFNLRDMSQNFLWHRRLGCGPVVTDLQRGVRYPTVLHRVIRHRLSLETLAEEMRLLYVAFTRARERLILTAAVKKLERQVDTWRSQVLNVPAEGALSASLLAGAKGPLDWLGPALWAHPGLAGFDCTQEPREACGDSWRVFLWPASSLDPLWKGMEQEYEPEDRTWLDCLKNLQPLPEDWVRRQEGKRATMDAGILRRRLFWTYPYRELAGLPSKVTVTEWRHRQEEMEEQTGDAVPAPGLPGYFARRGEESLPGFDLPAFYTGERYDGAERGRVVHLVMENIELIPPLDRARVQRQLDSLVDREILRPEQRRLVRAEEIANFFAGNLGRRVLDAARKGFLWREVPFTLGLPVPELYPELAGKVPGEDFILLQGVIDCLLVEEGGLVLIDYKTDRLTGKQLDDAVSRYRVQLELYARAARTILRRPVREKYLYFFALNRAATV